MMRIISLVVTLFIFPGAVWGISPKQSKHVQTRLLTSHSEIRLGESFYAGVEFEIDPGWHVYWKNPGDSGLPTRVNWEMPEGVVAGAIQWPVPERQEFSGMMNYGYKDRVTLLSTIQVPEKIEIQDGFLSISANLKWLVCNDICLPGSSVVEGKIKVGNNRTRSAHFRNLSREISKHPVVLAADSYSSDLTVTSDEIEVNVFGHSFGNVSGVFPVTDRVVLNASIPKVESMADGLRLTWPRDPQGIEKVDHFDFVVVGSSGAFELGAMTKQSHSLAWILLLAFFGGLLLNLMPCVFPVLSIKAMSIVKKAAKSTHRIRRDGAFYSLGVVSFFLVIGLGLFVLRATGEHLGWGYQLQSPTFVVFILLFMLFLGMNLIGAFELPMFGLDITKKTHRHADIESFITGAIAVLIATPCTAPFMGSALGFAVVQPPLIALFVFLFLGLGMSFPYWMISFFPQLTRVFPKPGPWMQTLKEILAFPLFLTVGWLIWVLILQVGFSAFLPVFSAGLLLVFFIWLSQKTKNHKKQRVVLIIGFLVSWFFASVMINDEINVVNQDNEVSAGQISENGIQWGKYTPEEVTEALSNGQMVFVNFTAAWCLTCKVNEKVTFSSDRVLEKVRDYNLKMLKADWTNHDPQITDILLRHGRAGIPFYLLYRKLNAKPEVLPEVLTPSVFIQTLKNE